MIIASVHCYVAPPGTVRCKDNKNDHLPMVVFVMSALRIFPGRRQPSIVRMKLLNYRVRNGNGWDQLIINTDYC